MTATDGMTTLPLHPHTLDSRARPAAAQATQLSSSWGATRTTLGGLAA
ncbi:hypothetical protein ACWGN5_17350 [Streptomyces sp. NPDC055815]